MIRHSTKSVLTALFALAAVSATAQQALVADKVVAVVGNSPILYSEVVDYTKTLAEEYRSQGYTSEREPMSEALENLMLQKLLYNQALIDSVEINQSVVPQYLEPMVQQLIDEAGSVKELEKQQGKPIFKIRDEVRSQIEEMLYANAMRSTIEDKIKITPGEVDKFFKRIHKDSLPLIPEQYTYAQIVLYPASTKEAKQRTRERLLELRERITKGERFDVLARIYSVCPSARVGGEIGPSPKQQFLPSFADALGKLSVGQISNVVETEQGLHIIQLLEKTSGDMYRFRHILLRPSFTTDEIMATIQRADSISDAVRSGSMTFAEAAAKYSDDAYSRKNGGIVSNHDYMEAQGEIDPSKTTTKFLKEAILPDDYKALRGLGIGEISPAFQTEDLQGNVIVKTLQMVEIIPTHDADLTKDYLILQQAALAEKQDKEFEQWVNGKIDAMYVRIDPSFKKEDFENRRWFK